MLLAGFAAGTLRAEETPFSAIADLAAALSANNAGEALAHFDPKMAAYPEIEQKIQALIAQTNISCSIDVVSDETHGDTHKLDLDWFFQLTSQADPSRLERRRMRVQVEMREVRGRWRITSFNPMAILEALTFS